MGELSTDYSRDSMHAETDSVRETFGRLCALGDKDLAYEAAHGIDEYTRTIAADLLSCRDVS